MVKLSLTPLPPFSLLLEPRQRLQQMSRADLRKQGKQGAECTFFEGRRLEMSTLTPVSDI